jgi:hypothetical protein
MKILIKTQVLSIVFAIFWVLYLNILAFFDQPGRALQHLNWFVFGFAFLFAIIYLVLIKYVIGYYWLAVPLVILPYLLIYQPFLERILLSLVSKSYGMMLKFLSQSTGTTYLIAILFGLVFGIMFSKRQSRFK